MTAVCGFVLVAVGTLGLLLNEFAFDWGRGATLSLAAANGIGLFCLLLVALRKRQR